MIVSGQVLGTDKMNTTDIFFVALMLVISCTAFWQILVLDRFHVIL